MNVVQVTPRVLAALTAGMQWYDGMPESLQSQVGERFYDNFRNWQESLTPNFFDKAEYYLSHFEIGEGGVPVVVLGTHEGGGSNDDLTYYKFAAE